MEKMIVEHVKGMSEESAKKTLASLLLNYNRIGRGGYTKDDCMKDYEKYYSDIVVKDIFK